MLTETIRIGHGLTSFWLNIIKSADPGRSCTVGSPGFGWRNRRPKARKPSSEK